MPEFNVILGSILLLFGLTMLSKGCRSKILIAVTTSVLTMWAITMGLARTLGLKGKKNVSKNYFIFI